MRTKLQGRRSILLWVQYLVLLTTAASVGYLMYTSPLWPAAGGGGESTATAVAVVTLATATPTVTPSPNIVTLAVTQVLTPPSATPEWTATATTAAVRSGAVATFTPTVFIAPTLTATTASVDRAQLREQVLAATRSSRIRNAYPQQTEQLVDALLAHLPEFQLPTLGVTTATMQQALKRPDVGDRLNALVQEVWADWSGIAGRKSFDLNTREPTYAEHNLSPLRQLVIRLIQDRQGTLADYQQHGLHNLLTRSEEASVWSSNIDGVIGAVNRDSFQWP